jgi:chorismate mutase/prephenate dehydratase
MDLKDFRGQLDRIDDEILELFIKRMEVCRQVAHYKKANRLPIYDAAREMEKLTAVGKKAGADIQSYSCKLFSTLFEISRAYQNGINADR